MRTLYRGYISAALLMIGISVLIGFVLANAVYMMFTEEGVTQKNLGVAEEIVRGVERVHTLDSQVTDYLQSIGSLGYQMVLIHPSGESYTFGEPFERSGLPERTIAQVLDGRAYLGKDGLWDRLWMMGQFSSDIRYAIGLPVNIKQQTYALFVKRDSRTSFSEIHVILASFFVIISLVSLLGVMILAKGLIRPISELSEAVKAISQGNFDYSLHIRRKDELGQLAENVLQMQHRLKHNDIARKSFINNVSHDFQSPLLNIQGYADLLRSPGLKEEERQQYAEIVSDEARRLSNLTKQLLLMTSLDQSGYPVKNSPVRLDRLIKDSIKKHQWSMQDRNISVSYKLDEVVLISDRELLAMVWDNLITNAVKYNKPNGHIHITCAAEGNRVVVAFEDSGIGLTEEAAALVFDRFYRVDATRKKDGTGLGLSIVKEIVALLHGSISLESEPGRGTTFTVEFSKEDRGGADA